MPFFFSGDRKSTTCPAGASNVATTITVAAAAATDFTTGPRMFEVQTTGETFELTAGWGTTTWTIVRGQNQTNAATIPAGAVILEESGANEYSNFLQRDETALPPSMLATTTPIVEGTGAVGSSTKAARADHVHPSGGGGSTSDATTTTTGVVVVDHAPSGAHPVALTTDGVAVPSGMLGTSSTKAMPGNATPTPAGHHVSHENGGSDQVSLDASQIRTGALAKARQNANTAYTDVATTFAAEVTVPDLKITGLTGSNQVSRQVGATSSGAPTTGPHLVGDASLSLADGKWYVCTVAGTPGTFVTASVSGSGTVTSVGLSAPGTLFSVAGTPIVSSGTFSLSLIAQNANMVLAGPTSGAAAVPTVRSLVSADLPVATSSLYGAMKPDNVTTSVAGGVISATGASAPVGSYSANAQPAIPPDSVSLIDRFRGGAQTVVGSIINEFDLQYYNGVYYLAHNNGTATVLKHGSTIAAAIAATADVTFAANAGMLPSILFDGTTWHLWGDTFTGSTWNLQHYTSSTFGGTYTLADTTTLNTFDTQVRLNPLDGNFYCSYGRYVSGTSGPARVGMLKASSPGGTWTDLGLIFSGIGDPPYATSEFDPTPVFWNGRAYMLFSCTDPTSHSHLAMVELDPTTMKAITPATVILDSLETSGSGYTPAEMSNPIFLAVPGQPGQEKIYINAASGLISMSVGHPIPDGRRRQDGLRLNTSVGLDHATGLQATSHGGATWGPYGLTCAATPSGAYGYLNRTSLTDFTLPVAFTLTAIPGSAGLLLRASPSAMGANEASIRVTSGGVLQGKVIGSTTLTLTGSTVLTTNTVYLAVLRRIGSEVRLYLGTNQEAIGTQGDALTGLTEWSVGNDKGASQTAGEQLLCSIFGAAVCGEALPLSADPLVGLEAALPTLPIATTSTLGGMKPDGSTLTVDPVSGVATAITTVVPGVDHLHGLARWTAGGGTTFDLPDLAEYLEMIFDNGSAVEAFSLSADRTQVVFDSAPTTGHVLQATYVLARI